MKTLIRALSLASIASAALLAAGPDPRLATVRMAYVTLKDDLGDGKPVAACLAERLAKNSPIAVTETRQDADVVLTVLRARLPGNTTRAIGLASAVVELQASLPDGTKLWTGTYKWGSVNDSLHIDIPCALADGITDELRKAMRKARDRK